MTKNLQIYKCEICGNIVEMLHTGAGSLVCCGKPMKLIEEKTADTTTEKHVPVIEKLENGYKITVGSTLHPMKEEHYIEWIEIETKDGILRKHLKAGDEPIAVFDCVTGYVKVREYCNVHGLWINK